MSSLRPSLLAALAASLIACAPSGSPGRDAGRRALPPPGTDAGPGRLPPGDACAGGPPTRVSGVVTFPNGTLPVARALVYVPVDPVAEVPRSGTCGECIDRGAVSAVTETGVDGRFELAVPAGTTTVVIQKGPFVRRLPVTITACADNPLAPEMSRLPRDASEGTVPRIAVVTGTYDHMETVLERLGIASSVVEIVPGDPELGGNDGGAALFRDRARLMGFDYVFVNCGAGIADGYYGPTPLGEAAIQENIRAFVEGGGRLYVTDLANDVVEVALPSAVDFGGGNGMSETPEPLDSASSGTPIDTAVSAEVVDEDLRAWLAAAGALDGSGRMQVRGLELGWVMVEQASPERATTWVRGPLDSSASGVRPLTVTADRGCGRALFTSYHTLEGAGGGGLSPQEMALAYLVLEIGNCIEEPTII